MYEMSGKKLLDSNVIIDLSKNLLSIEAVIESKSRYFISVITKMEVLGFNFERKAEESFIRELLSKFELLYIDDKIANKTIEIRKNKKIKLPDAIIAATAIVSRCELLTSNIDDFKFIDDKLKLKNPSRV